MYQELASSKPFAKWIKDSEAMLVQQAKLEVQKGLAIEAIKSNLLLEATPYVLEVFMLPAKTNRIEYSEKNNKCVVDLIAEAVLFENQVDEKTPILKETKIPTFGMSVERSKRVEELAEKMLHVRWLKSELFVRVWKGRGGKPHASVWIRRQT